MSASASRTISPSSLSRTRSTPWVLGWCGPMLSSIHSASGSCSGPIGSWAMSVLTTDGVGLQPFEFLIAEDHRLPKRDVILAQRKPLPGRWHEDAPQVGVPVERDAEQVPGLAFVPVRRGPDRSQTGHVGIGHRRGGLETDPGLVGQRAHLQAGGEGGAAGWHVGRRRMEEVVEPLLNLEVPRDVDQRAGFDYHAEVASEVRALLQRRFEALADPLHERTRGVHTHLARLNAGATTQPSGGTLDQRFTADLALELDDGVQQGLRTRGTAREVNVDGDDLVHALDDRVAVEHPGG